MLNARALGSQSSRFGSLAEDLHLAFTFEDRSEWSLTDDQGCESIFSNESKFVLRSSVMLQQLMTLVIAKQPSLMGRKYYGYFELKATCPENFMILDVSAIRTLNLFPLTSNPKETSSTIFDMVSSHVITQMGKRTLREWLLQPLRVASEIAFRLSCVEMYNGNFGLRQETRALLKRSPNLDKLLSKLWRRIDGCQRSFTLVDCVAIYNLVLELRHFVDKTSQFLNTESERGYLQLFRGIVNDFSNFVQLIEADASREYFIRPECSPQLQTIGDALREDEKEIGRLRVSLERTLECNVNLLETVKFGTVFETKKDAFVKKLSHCSKYQIVTTRKNTLTFTLPELVDLNERVRGLRSRYLESQREFTEILIETVITYSSVILATNQVLIEQDLFSAFSEMMSFPQSDNVFSLPQIVTSSNNVLEVQSMWHPCLRECVSNDLSLGGTSTKGVIITGPNMGGKSTFIRTAGLVALLAHVGMPVPAKRCRVSLMSGIYFRVGASDVQQRGISTFFYWIVETGDLLRLCHSNPSRRSADLARRARAHVGLGLSRAILENMLDTKGLTLFATHFFELTQLSSVREDVRNVSMKTVEDGHDICFTYKTQEGAAAKSYGIELIKSMGFPETITEDATLISDHLETNSRRNISLIN